MTTARGRRIQGRRALAIMAWVTLVIVAGLLWYGQHNRIIRIQAWEPAALLLSAYATFLAIFGWLLFSPGRKSAEESPGLFFAGLLTLLPPCFIAYHLMPAGSPLKPWMTIGVFVFGIIAIMSPLPDEVFAVPRDRRSYLQPLTDAYLSELNVDEPQVRFDEIAPRTRYWLTRPQTDSESQDAATARDPWADPFYGTGRQMSRIGGSQSRRSDDPARRERRRTGDDAEDRELLSSLTSRSDRDAQTDEIRPSFSNLTPLNSAPRTVSQSIRTDSDRGLPLRDQIPRLPETATGYPAPSSLTPPRSSETNRARDLRGTDGSERAVGLQGNPLNPQTPIPSAASRRPLTEPSGRSATTVGFQSPPLTSVAGTRDSSLTPPPLPETDYSPKSSPAVNFPAISLPPSRPSVPVAPVPLSPVPVPSVSTGSVATGSVTTTSGKLPASSESTRSSPSSLPAGSAAVPKADLSRPANAGAFPSRPLSEIATGISTAAAGSQLSSSIQGFAPERSSVQDLNAANFVSRAASGIPGTSGDTLKELDRQLRQQEERDAADDLSAETEDISRAVAQQRGSGAIPGSQRTSNDVALERIRDEHGGEMIEGTIKVFFEVGQKRAHLHVPFSPPLAGVPEVECEPAGDDPVRLKVAVRQPYGVRIEARRSEASEALRTEVSFAAVYTPPSGRG